MAQCRNLLPVSRLPEFREWLVSKTRTVRDGKGPHQVFQVSDEGHWYPIYTRSDTKAGNPRQFASIYGPVVDLAKEFLKERPA